MPYKPKHRRFGEWLTTRRKELGLTQVELAEKSDLAVNTIHRWENGDVVGAHTSKLEQLAAALEVPFGHLELVQRRSQEDYNREQRAYAKSAEFGLSEDQIISLVLSIGEETGALVDLDDIRSELGLEFDSFRAAACILANKMRQLPKSEPGQHLRSDSPLRI